MAVRSIYRSAAEVQLTTLSKRFANAPALYGPRVGQEELAMIITRTAAVAVIGAGLAASGALLTQSLAGERAAPGPLVTTTTTPLPIDVLVA